MSSVPPEPIPPGSPPPIPPGPSPAASSGNEDRNLAMLTHLSGIILGFIVPLIVWLISKDDAGKSYLVTEAKEALNFQIAVLIGYIICSFLAFILIGLLLLPLLWIFNLVFCILAALAVNNSGSYRYPITLRLIN